MAASEETESTVTFSQFTTGVWRENPVFVMLLGLCPVLAVSNSVINALTMGLASTLVVVCSSTIVSLIRRSVPKEVRIATYIVIIAAFVTAVDYGIQAISLELYDALGAYISLIVVNCMILGRAEAFASKHGTLPSILDALGMGLGFTLALLCLGGVRELLGSGSLAGVQLFGPKFQTWSIMILPPGAFFVLGGWLLLFAWLKERKKEG
jgi:electron transport complex protein RnfE